MTSFPILVTRPEPACGETVARLIALGHDAVAAPALMALPLPVRPLTLTNGTLIVTSPQAARFLRHWPQLHTHPVLAVGAQTAALLAASGFANITVGGGTAASLPDLVKTTSAILLGAPSTGHVLLRQLRAQGIAVRRVNVYRVGEPAQLPAEVMQLLQTQATHVLFYSARTARSFMRLTNGMSLQRHAALCLSPVIARVAQAGGFGQVHTAAQPTGIALQAALQRLPPALG